MDILYKKVQELTYKDIIDFCNLKNPEGFQLDYKESISSNLSKHFAAFSNKRGGLIIIGVKEDDKTGVPLVFEGIDNDSKILERIHQLAAELDPLPSYEVSLTDERDGKVFALIRIFEGPSTPYFVHNDSNVYVRTGNITKKYVDRYDIATPEELKSLFDKQKQAQLARDINIQKAEEIYQGYFENRIEIAKESNSQDVVQKELDSAMYIKVSLQPYFPSESYFSPSQLKDMVYDLRVSSQANVADFISTYGIAEPIQLGVAVTSTPREGLLNKCEIVHSNGLLYCNFDVSYRGESGSKSFWISWLFSQMIALTLSAKKFYDKAGYSGTLIGRLECKKMKNAVVNVIIPRGWYSHDDKKSSLLDNYIWNFKLDTNQLNSVELRNQIFRSILNDIYSSFRYTIPSDDLFNAYMKEDGWSEGV